MGLFIFISIDNQLDVCLINVMNRYEIFILRVFQIIKVKY